MVERARKQFPFLQKDVYGREFGRVLAGVFARSVGGLLLPLDAIVTAGPCLCEVCMCVCACVCVGFVRACVRARAT